MSIILTGELTPSEVVSWLAQLRPLMPTETLLPANDAAAPSEVDVAIVANPAPGELARYPRLRFVQSLWAGVDRLLGDPGLPDVPIARLVDPSMTQSMVECVAAAVLYLHRQLPAYRALQERRLWRPLAQPYAAQRSVVVLGFGELGQAAARSLTALGFDVAAWGRRERPPMEIEYAHGADGLEALVGRADILTNLLPLTPQTRGILDLRLFERLRMGSSLINVGRGAHLVEADLLQALASGRIAHAVLDVFREEPLPPGHAFWSHPQITVLPHVAAATDPASAASLVAANIAAFRAGGSVTGLVSRSLGY